MASKFDSESAHTPISLVGGRYRLNALVGKGGMGAVYKAFDEQLKRFVAIKCLLCTTDRSSKESALQEAWTLSSINHPNVMQIFDVVTIEDQIWLVTEWVDGRVLSEFDGAMHPLVTAALMSQVYQGLAASHEKGIIHRDVKPANIMVTNRGRVILLDYGVALAPGVSSGETIVGSLRYTDSRILEGQKADQYSDLFSAGLVTLELLKGKPVLPELAPLPAYRYIQEKLERRMDSFSDGLYPPLSSLAMRYLLPHVKTEHISSEPFEAHHVADEVHDIFVELTEHSPYKVLEKFHQGTFDWSRAIARVEEITDEKLKSTQLSPKDKAAWFSYSESLKRHEKFIANPDLPSLEPEEVLKVFTNRSGLQRFKGRFSRAKSIAATVALFAASILVFILLSRNSSNDPNPADALGNLPMKSEVEEKLDVPNPDEAGAPLEKGAVNQEKTNEVVRQAVKEAVKEAMVEANREQDSDGQRSITEASKPKLTVRTFVLNEPGRLYINGVNQGFIIDRKPISISLGTHEIWVERNGQLQKLPPVTIGSTTAKVIRVEKQRSL